MNRIVYAHHEKPTQLRMYVTGFVTSLILTVWAYLLATRHRFTGWTLVIGLFVLAIAQFFVQVYYFLHLGSETKPRWKLYLLFMMMGIVLIVVLGSIWIMYNLNYNMSHQQIQNYLQHQDGGI